MKLNKKTQIPDSERKTLIKNNVEMRHNHKELIRKQMQESGKYSHDICSLSIADILQLIEYNKYLTSLSEEELTKLLFPHGNVENRQTISSITIHEKSLQNLEELNAYIFEFNMKLSNRTVDFNLFFK